MEKHAAYTGLSEWFEYLNDDCDYEKWSQYLISRLQGYPVKTGVDFGCGAGWFTRAFYRAGYQTTGVDISEEMLTKAEENARKGGERCRFLKGDIAAFHSPEKFGFATAINDCINYLPKHKLKSAFSCVYKSLQKGGVFLFDISSKKKFQEKIARSVNVDDREEVTYLSFGSLNGDEATLDVTLFIKEKDGKYTRFDETHTQYMYSEEEILSALQQTGFSLIEVTGHLGEEKSTSDRVVFFAQKK